MSELLKKFILKFPEDPTYGRLVNVIENGVLEDVEREVHTLKGLTANLGHLWIESNLQRVPRLSAAAQNHVASGIISAHSGGI